GVALEPVGRKDLLSSTLRKIWALQLDSDGQYMALHVSPTPLALLKEPRRTRTDLSCGEHQVTFCNAENMMQILQFKTHFAEEVFPFFCLWSRETCIQLCD
ncbi:TRI10 protein, partial [Atrichornis clamosus]|nr:TRI10 protein [Atrichornis clamosus]